MFKIILKKHNIFSSNIHIREVLKGGLISFGVKMLTLLIGFFTTWFISTRYGASVLGQLALLNSLVGMITVFSVMGMNNSLVKLVPEHIAKYSFYSALLTYKKSIIFVSTFSIIIALIYYFFSEKIAENIFHKSHLAWVFVLATPLISIKSIQSINIALIQAMKKINLLAFFQLLQPILFTSLIVLSSHFYFDEKIPIYSQVIVDVLLLLTSTVVIYIVAYRKTKFGYFQKPCNYDLLSLSLPMMLTGVFTVVLFQTDTIMLGIIKTDVEVGIYSVVMKIASLVSFVLLAINTIAAPKFSELYHQNDMENLKIVAQKFSKLLLIISLCIGLILIAFASYILSYFGNEYIIGSQALMLIIIGWIFNAWAGPVAVMMNMTGLHKELQYIVGTVSVMNVILNMSLIPDYGITGAAAASMISGIMINVLTTAVVFKKQGFFVLYFPKLTHEKI